MQKIAASLTFLLMITTGAKLAADQDANPAAAKQSGGQVEIRTVQTADKSHVAGPSLRSENDVPAPLSAWLEDPSVMDGSWRRWPSLTDF